MSLASFWGPTPPRPTGTPPASLTRPEDRDRHRHRRARLGPRFRLASRGADVAGGRNAKGAVHSQILAEAPRQSPFRGSRPREPGFTEDWRRIAASHARLTLVNNASVMTRRRDAPRWMVSSCSSAPTISALALTALLPLRAQGRGASRPIQRRIVSAVSTSTIALRAPSPCRRYGRSSSRTSCSPRAATAERRKAGGFAERRASGLRAPDIPPTARHQGSQPSIEPAARADGWPIRRPRAPCRHYSRRRRHTRSRPGTTDRKARSS